MNKKQRGDKMISVVIPTYNREKLIERAIRSVMNQTYKDIEIIVIDDASTDNTEQVVKNIKYSNIKYFKQNENGGACRARNRGIKESNGDYIAFLDSDDEWDKNKLERQITFLKEKKADIVVCNYYYSKNNKKSIAINRKNEIISYDELLYSNCITTGAILSKKNIFENIYFDESMPRYQDWDLVLRIAQTYDIYFINQPLLTLYFQETSITNSTSKQKKYDALEKIFIKNKEQLEKNKKALAHIYWSMGMYSLFTDHENKKYLKKGLIFDKNMPKRLIIYILINIGFKNKIKEIYAKEH